MDTDSHIIYINTLNDLLTCKLCTGYLVDATAICECLHTFCKSCLVKHLTYHNSCPLPGCRAIVHSTHPLEHIRSDVKLQDLVYRIVPGLKENERQRVEQFYSERGLVDPRTMEVEARKTSASSTATSPDKSQEKAKSQQQAAQPPPPVEDEFAHKVGVVLTTQDEDTLEQIPYRYFFCQANASVTVIKKFISLQLYETTSKHTSLDLLYNDELLGKDHILKFVLLSRHKFKKGPLYLTYRKATRD